MPTLLQAITSDLLRGKGSGTQGFDSVTLQVTVAEVIASR